jgi:hypothetical protein
MPFQQTRANSVARIIGWILLVAHSLLSLLALIAIQSNSEGAGWWPVVFAVDFPVSIPVFWTLKYFEGDLIPFVLFVAVGSLWHFYWPQFLVALVQNMVRIIRKSTGHT